MCLLITRLQVYAFVDELQLIKSSQIIYLISRSKHSTNAMFRLRIVTAVVKLVLKEPWF